VHRTVCPSPDVAALNAGAKPEVPAGCAGKLADILLEIHESEVGGQGRAGGE
jgi:hypothetical protein